MPAQSYYTIEKIGEYRIMYSGIPQIIFNEHGQEEIISDATYYIEHRMRKFKLFGKYIWKPMLNKNLSYVSFPHLDQARDYISNL